MSLFDLTPFGRIRIAGSRDLRAYISRTTLFCVALALAFDVINQLIFFESWTVAFRSWIVTVGIVMVVAIPVSRAIGKAHLALFQASRTDHLTGLLNRRALFDGADDGSAVMVLMIVDIDRFKSVNDTYGHLAGDAVLCTVAQIMKRDLTEIGLVGRLGGEEFALVCTRQNDEALLQRLETFREAIAQTPFLVNGIRVAVTISAGVASRRSTETFEELYAEADQALYAAKASGRDRIVVAGPRAPHSGARPEEAVSRSA